LDQQAHKDLKVQRVTPARLAHKARPGRREQRAIKVILVRLDPKAHKDLKVQKVTPARLALKAQLGQRDQRAIKD